MRHTTKDKLRDCVKQLLNHHPEDLPDVDFVTFGLATEYLRWIVGNEWTNQIVFSQHPTVERRNRSGRAFMRAESPGTDDKIRNQERALRIAELIFNLQDIEGIDARIEDLRTGNVESSYAELEHGTFLYKRKLEFRYVDCSGIRGADYDAEILLATGEKVNCEMKCKVEGTKCSLNAVRNSLETARKQLPADGQSVVFLKIPELWTSQHETAKVVNTAIQNLLRNTSRIVAVVLVWEEQYFHGEKFGWLILYKYRLVRDEITKSRMPQILELLNILEGPAKASLTSFREISAKALNSQ